ncbi:MAG TPA: hypothetical protein VGA31_01955 [Thermoanaerobaculia bacterium]
MRPHSGWSALVAVAGTPRSPEVLDRRRIEIADPAIKGSMQPYHAAEGLGLDRARKYLDRCEQGARRRAREGLKKALDDLRSDERQAVGCGMLFSSGRALPALPAILGSHALIHSADGEHFRDALREAASHFGLSVDGVREKEIWERASADLGIPIAELQRLVNAIGKTLGPPWTQDQKLAALSGWLALAHAE